jgi:flagellar hook-length control protein FliK
MATIDINQYMGPLLFETAPPETGAGNAHDLSDKSFDDYLNRARTSSSGNGDNGKSGLERESPQSPAPPAENSPTAASCAQSQNDIMDRNPEDADSAEISNQVETNGRQPEDAQRPIDKAQDDPNAKEGKGGEKKETHNEQEPSALQQAQAFPANVQINHPAADKNNKLPIENKIATEKAETMKTVDPLSATVEDAQKIIDPGASVVKSTKGRAKKVVNGNGQKAEIALAEKQTDGISSLSNDKSPAVTKTSKEPVTAARDGQQKTSHKTANKEGLSAHLADSPVSESVSVAAPVAPAINAAALKADIIPSATKLSQPADNPKTESATNKNADMTINTAQRLASADKIAAGLSQSLGDGAQSQLDRVRFVQRVERAFAAVGDRGGSLRLKLSPPELGSLRLEITVRKGTIRARVEAETPEAKNLLLENLSALRDRLAQQDIKIQQFDVDLMDRSPGGTPQQANHQAPSGSRQDGYRNSQSQSHENSDAASSSAKTVSLRDHNGQLNVIV